jgi:hypothetical protein
MKPVIFISAICLVATTALAQSGAGETGFPEMNDYAWGFPVVAEEEASFYSIRLPLEVNRSVTDPELRDAGVYNADGEPVPRVFQPASDDVEQIERSRQLPFVPLFTDTDAVDNEDIRLLFERRGDYARLELTTDETADEPPEPELMSYIVDTRELEEAVEALDLFWAQSDAGFIGQVTIEGSDNLRNWNALGSAAVADLDEESTSIVQRRVDLSNTKHDFLRVSWRDLPDDWTLAEINGVYTLGVPGIVREKITLGQSEIDAADGGRIFSLGGAPKIDRLRILLPETNTVIAASIYLWSGNQGRWYRVTQGSWHHIGRGDNVIKSDPVKISRTRSTRIKVVVTGGQPDAELQLEVGWRPDTLLFLAQGPAPFTLAAGRAADAETGFPQQSTYGVTSIASLATDNRQATATLGTRYSLGGADQLQIEEVTDWRTVILWLGLALGVGFVGFMATRILRETGNQETTDG